MNLLFFAVIMIAIAVANTVKDDIRVSHTESDSKTYQEGPRSPKVDLLGPKGANGPSGEDQ